MSEIESKLEVVLNECCAFYNTSKRAVLRRTRTKTLVDTKRAYCFVCSRLNLDASLNKIGSVIGINHSCFNYHVRTAKDRAKIYKTYACQLDYLEHHCRNEIDKTVGGDPYLMAMNNLGRAYLFDIEVDKEQQFIQSSFQI